MKHTCPAIIAPSLLSCDLARLADDAQNVLSLGGDWLVRILLRMASERTMFHISFSRAICLSLSVLLIAYGLDGWSMVSEPAKWVTPLQQAGSTSFTFHLESDLPENDPRIMIQLIRQAGMKVGIAIKPKTPVEDLFPYMNDIDLALIMTVEPGFSGQKFMPDMMSKVETLRSKYPNVHIQVDGGLSPETIDVAATAGANVIVAASAIFGAPDRKAVMDQLRAGVEQCR
jgi:ribulose-phosphate 3-epimerase